MLLNEFLKEHRKNERQEATIADLKAEIDSLCDGETAGRPNSESECVS
jgi:cell division protein FtsB